MGYATLDDKQLLTLLHESNEEAFAELYDRHWRRVYSITLSYIRQPEIAQDMVQEVFLKLWTKKHELTEVRDFKAYLDEITRNMLISTLRKKVFHVYLDPEEPVATELLLPDHQLSYKESVNLYHKAVNLLPPQQQQAYQLSRNEGMRYEDIARRMGISPLTVRNHISKALHFLQQYLSDHSIHPALAIILGILYKRL